jgi:hypothetical protein
MMVMWFILQWKLDINNNIDIYIKNLYGKQ